MKRLISYSSAVGLAAILTGCIIPAGPTGGISALVYTDVSGPVGGVMGNVASTKTGTATVEGVICVATGDASIKTACLNGGITKVHHVDYHTTSVLGIWGKTVVTVYGE